MGVVLVVWGCVLLYRAVKSVRRRREECSWKGEREKKMLLGVGAGGRDVCKRVDSRSERNELEFGV